MGFEKLLSVSQSNGSNVLAWYKNIDANTIDSCERVKADYKLLYRIKKTYGSLASFKQPKFEAFSRKLTDHKKRFFLGTNY